MEFCGKFHEVPLGSMPFYGIPAGSIPFPKVLWAFYEVPQDSKGFSESPVTIFVTLGGTRVASLLDKLRVKLSLPKSSAT